MPQKIKADTIHIAPLTREHAQDISTWRYDAPYDVYDMVGVNPDVMLDPAVGYHAVMAEDCLIGFRSFGPDGQVPGWEYDDSAFRVTAASFNVRALHTVASLGFQRVGSFKASRDARAFDVLVRAETR